MAFSDTQTRQLKAKLDSLFVKTRKADGITLHYIEGWHAIAEANRIFGHDAWDRRTLAARCVWTETSGQDYLAAYIAKVRIRVRAGDVTIVREGSGTGEARAPTPGQAHEVALKSAETDATKRALATFGNPFGLALYDREQIGVRHRPNVRTATEHVAKSPWILRAATGALEGSFVELNDFDKALRTALTEAQTSNSCSQYGSKTSTPYGPLAMPLSSSEARTQILHRAWLPI
jgi:Rad52/22 family double-strand break repair protein